MQTSRDFTTAERAETLARVLHAGAGRALEQAERVAHAVGTGVQRAVLWLRQVLDYEGMTGDVLVALGYDRWVVDAADTLVLRPRESVPEYGQRVAACQDANVLAVAVAVIDDELRERIEDPPDTRAAYGEARRVLKRAADALANEKPGDRPPAGGMADGLPTAPALRSALLTLGDHAAGVQGAMREMHRGPGDEPWEVLERLDLDDMEMLLYTLHDLLQVVGMLVIDVTAGENENTYEDRMSLTESKTKDVPVMEGMATIAETTARRLRDTIAAHRGEDGETGKVH